jgi:hypothetical protein
LFDSGGCWQHGLAFLLLLLQKLRQCSASAWRGRNYRDREAVRVDGRTNLLADLLRLTHGKLFQATP